MAIHKKMKLDSSLSSCSKVDSKWTKDLSMKLDTLKLLEENRDSIMQHAGVGKDLLSRIRSSQKMRAIIDKWDLLGL